MEWQVAEGEPRSITRLLNGVGQGRRHALSELWNGVLDELRLIARGKLATGRSDEAMESTDLVNETYLRLFGRAPIEFKNRKHFYCYAAKVMTHLLIDNGRVRRRHLSLEDASRVFSLPPDNLADLNECLERLEAINPRWADVVRLRFFTRRTVEQTAEYLEVSTRTVEDDWSFARTWLHRCLKKGDTTVGVAAKARSV